MTDKHDRYCAIYDAQASEPRPCDCKHSPTLGDKAMTYAPLIDGAMELARDIVSYSYDEEDNAQRISDFARAYAGELEKALQFYAGDMHFQCEKKTGDDWTKIQEDCMPTIWIERGALARKALDGKRED